MRPCFHFLLLCVSHDVILYVIPQREDLQRMEWLLLETVDWRIRVPNSLVFLRQYHNALLYEDGVVPADVASMAAFKTCANFLAVRLAGSLAALFGPPCSFVGLGKIVACMVQQ